MEKSLYEKTVSETTKMLLSSVFMFVIQFASTIVLARIYSPDEFGLLSKITIITSFADVFCQLGLGPAIVQKANCTERDYQTAASASLLLGLVTSTVILCLANPISDIVKIDNSVYLRIISPAFFITALSVLPLARAQREMRFGVIVRKDVISYVVYLIVSITCGVCGLGVFGLIIGLLTKYIVATFIALISVRNSISLRFYKESFYSMFKFGLGFSICKICSVATDQSDYYTIARKLDNNALGLYHKAFQLISTPISLIGQGVDQVFFSSFSKIQDKEKRIGDLFVSISAIISIVSMVATVCIFYFSGIITIILFGREWIEASVPISVLSIAIFFRASIKITDPIMRAKGLVYQRALFHCINTAMTIIAAMIGSRNGLLGVSLGVVVAQFANYLINAVYVGYRLKVSIIRYVLSTFPCVFVMTIACLLGVVFSTMPSIWGGVFNTKVATVIITAMLLSIVFGFISYKYIFDKEIKEEVQRLASIFLNMLKNVRKRG